MSSGHFWLDLGGFGSFLAGSGHFWLGSGGFWLGLGGFVWVRMVSGGFGWFQVLSVMVVYQSIPSMYTTPGQNTKAHFIDGKFLTTGMHGRKKVQPPSPGL